MNVLTEEQKREINAALDRLGANHPCCRCGNTQLRLLDAYFASSVQPSFDQFVIGGQAIPTIGIVCTRCGNISQHAVAMLGLPWGPPKPKLATGGD